MKKNVFKILSFVLVLCLTCGLFIRPQEYKADIVSYNFDFSNDNTYWCELPDNRGYNKMTFNYPSQTITVDSSVEHFIVFVKLPITVSSDETCRIELDMRHSVGTFGGGTVYLANDSSVGTTPLCMEVPFVSLGYPNYSVRGTISPSADATYLCIDYYLCNRSASNFFQPINNVYMEVYDNSADISNQILNDIDVTSKNIFDVLGDVFTSLVNLPVTIANNIKGFFENLGESINDKTDGLPSRIKDTLTSSFDNVVNSIKNLPSNIGGFFTNLGITIGGFFADYLTVEDAPLTGSDAILGELDGYMSEMDESGKIDFFNDVTLPDINKYDLSYVSVFINVFYDIPYVREVLTFCCLFAVIGLVLFGKR